MFSYFMTVLGTLCSIIGLYLFFEEDLEKVRIKLQGGIPKGFIIFITGTNGVGKTTIANKVAKKIGILSVVEVDDLRETMRSLEEIYRKAGQSDEYRLLSVSSYLSDCIEYNEDNKQKNYEEQCKLMTKAIKNVVLRKQNHGQSSIFEGINILPTDLIEHGISADYVLFVDLRVEPPELLKKRLLNKTDELKKKNNYIENLEKIVETDKIIEADFRSLSSIHRKNSNGFTQVHCMSVYNNHSVRRTVRRIVKEVRKISKE